MNKAEQVASLYQESVALTLPSQLNEALQKVNQTIKCFPKIVYLWQLKGLIHFRLKQFSQAVAAYDEALKLDPEDGSLWYDKGSTLGNLNKAETQNEVANAFYKAYSLPWKINKPTKTFSWYFKRVLFKSLRFGVTDTTLPE